MRGRQNQQARWTGPARSMTGRVALGQVIDRAAGALSAGTLLWRRAELAATHLLVGGGDHECRHLKESAACARDRGARQSRFQFDQGKRRPAATITDHTNRMDKRPAADRPTRAADWADGETKSQPAGVCMTARARSPSPRRQELKRRPAKHSPNERLEIDILSAARADDSFRPICVAQRPIGAPPAQARTICCIS
jgi:hypothetical protein